MNNNFKQILRKIETEKSLRVASHNQISNIWYSTRLQMIHLLNKQKTEEDINVQIYLDDEITQEQREIADIAMSLLPIREFKTSIILPEDYDYMLEWSQISEPENIDFEELFKKFGEESFINYQDAIDQLGNEDAYKYIEMYLARKKFMNKEGDTDIIINPSHVKWLNWIYTNGNVSKRMNRNNVFAKVEYNQ